MIKIVGVDPGKNGAYALIEDGILQKVHCFKKDIAECRALYHETPQAFYIEKVTASPQQGVVSAFTFGRYSECVETSARLTTIPVHMVRPQMWQNALGVSSGGDKSILYNHAKKLFPNDKRVSRDSADAILIALYGYKHFMYN